MVTDTLPHIKTIAVYIYCVPMSPAVVAIVGALYTLSVWSSIGSTLGTLYGLEPAEFPLVLREGERESDGVRNNTSSDFEGSQAMPTRPSNSLR